MKELVETLKEKGWIENTSYMDYLHPGKEGLILFFESSNLISIFINHKKKSERYVKNTEELIEFLKEVDIDLKL